MSEVSVFLVRDMFELAGFLVRLNRRYVAAQEESPETAADLYATNPHPRRSGTAPGFVLAYQDLPALERVSVKVRAWHTDSFAPARLQSGRGVFDFVGKAACEAAGRYFGAPFEKVLVVSRLPSGRQARDASLRILRERGVDRVIEFSTVLRSLADGVKVNKKYVGDDLLEVVRAFKSYGMLASPQMDLFGKAGR